MDRKMTTDELKFCITTAGLLGVRGLQTFVWRLESSCSRVSFTCWLLGCPSGGLVWVWQGVPSNG